MSSYLISPNGRHIYKYNREGNIRTVGRTIKPKQSFNNGDLVNIGFLTGFRVIRRIPTPGDYKPDKYLLQRGDTFYTFTPYNGGLDRLICKDVYEALVLFGLEENLPEL